MKKTEKFIEVAVATLVAGVFGLAILWLTTATKCHVCKLAGGKYFNAEHMSFMHLDCIVNKVE